MFERSISYATGEYLCIIGDDDGVSHEIVAATHWAKRLGLESLVPTLPVSYSWPDFRLRHYGDVDAGKLKIKAFDSRIQYLDSETELLKCAKLGFQEFTCLPKIYYGIVRKDMIDQVQSKGGSLFFGASPDLSGAIALACVVRTTTLLDYPLFVPGNSSSSGSGKSAMKKHVGSLVDEPQTKAFSSTWPPQVPRLFAVETVWAQAAIMTLTHLNRMDIVGIMNIPRLYAKTVVFNSRYSKSLISEFPASMAHQSKSLILGWLAFLGNIMRFGCARAYSHFSRFAKIGYFRLVQQVDDVANIQSAIKYLDKFLLQSNSKFKL